MKRPRANLFKRPLDWVFHAPSHVGVLRALKDSREGMSGRAVARAAGFTHQSCREAIAKLEALGLVRRQGSDKVQLISLNFEHSLLKEAILPMFAAESEAMAGLRSLLRDEFQGRARAATVFGSVARKEERPGSDLDLLLVVGKESRNALLERVGELNRRTLPEYGLRISPVVLTVREAKARLRRSEPLLANVLAEGVDILDSRLFEIIR